MLSNTSTHSNSVQFNDSQSSATFLKCRSIHRARPIGTNWLPLLLCCGNRGNNLPHAMRPQPCYRFNISAINKVITNL